MPKLEVKHVSSKSLDSSSSSSSHSFNSTSALKTVSIKSFIFIIILIGILIYISWCFFSNIFLIKNLQDENSLFEEEIIRLKKERKELNEQNDKLETEVKILEQQKSLKFTYDIGHEIIDGIKTEELVNILDERLNNIHMHTYQKDLDHYLIENINEQETIKKLLEKYGDNKTVVLEYAIDYVDGENFETKFKNYIEGAKIL